MIQVLLPMLAATCCVLVTYARFLPWFAWAIACVVCVVDSIMGVCLLIPIYQDKMVLDETIGGWLPPIGISYHLDALNAWLFCAIPLMGLGCLLYGKTYLHQEIAIHKHPMAYAVFLLCMAGLMGMVVTYDLFNMYVFLEISSIASYGLVAMGHRREANMAAFRYVMMGSIGALCVLLGIGLLYANTGTLHMQDSSASLVRLMHRSSVQMGGMLLLLGLCIKMALFPFYGWLIGCYRHAPVMVTCFFSSVSGMVAAYCAMRLLGYVFQGKLQLGALPIGVFLEILAVLTILVGSFMALYTKPIRSIVAYSSMVHMGYIMLGLSMHSVEGVYASIMLMMMHVLAKPLVFMCVLFPERCEQTPAGLEPISDSDLDSVGALAHRGEHLERSLRKIACLWALGAMIGVPLTAGFIGKWYLLDALMVSSRWEVVGVVAVSSVMGLIYSGRIVARGFSLAPPSHAPYARKQRAGPMDWRIILSILLVMVPLGVLGIWPQPMSTIGRSASETLFLDGRP